MFVKSIPVCLQMIDARAVLMLSVLAW